MKVSGDYHIHSQYSHGQGDLRANIQMAVSRGLKEIAITDHGPRAHSLVSLGVKKPQVLLEIKEKLRDLQKEFPRIKIMAGVEANIINHQGELDVPDEILNELDIVAAGLHLLIIPPDLITFWRLFVDNKIIYKLFPGRCKEIRKWNTETVINAVQNHHIDFITHPGYQLDIDTYALARACAGQGTCLEINARHGQLTEGFIRAASQTDVKFIINSDAHNPDAVGRLEAGIDLVRKLQLDPGRVINLSD